MSDILSRDLLNQRIDAWIAAGKRVIGPVKLDDGRIMYRVLKSADELVLDGFVHPVNSIKEFFFPRHEVLYRYRRTGKDVELIDAQPFNTPQIILAARPCDAASLPVLDHVFAWDYDDGFFQRRRALTTVVSLACSSHDEHCFCTSLGLAPDATRGSDALLFVLDKASNQTADSAATRYEVRSLTDKGKQLVAGHVETAAASGKPLKTLVAEVPKRHFTVDRIQGFLRERFEDPRWKTTSLRCVGCGSCAYTCPTCHCFDIVDEGNAKGGHRARNWDACQFTMFTMHASGHNPRDTQWQRQRQRVNHKFAVYPEKFGELLCTGCGNCSRNCPVGLGIRPVLETIGRAEDATPADRRSTAETEKLIEAAAKSAQPAATTARSTTTDRIQTKSKEQV